jgi:hypothetical protein
MNKQSCVRRTNPLYSTTAQTAKLYFRPPLPHKIHNRNLYVRSAANEFAFCSSRQQSRRNLVLAGEPRLAAKTVHSLDPRSNLATPVFRSSSVQITAPEQSKAEMKGLTLVSILERNAHTVSSCVLCGSQNKQRLFPYTALTGRFL